MNHAVYRSLIVVLSCWSIALAGCGGSSFLAGGPNFWPFTADADDAADMQRYGPTRAQRIETVQQMADRASSSGATAKERHEIAVKLAGLIQQEVAPSVRVEHIRALARSRSIEALPVLRAGLQDPDPRVREACCEAWGDYGGDEASAALGSVLGGDTNKDVRIAAARALGEFKSDGNVRALAVGLQDNDIAVQYRTMDSLGRVSGENLGYDAERWIAYTQGRTPKEPSSSIADRVGGLFRWF